MGSEIKGWVFLFNFLISVFYHEQVLPWKRGEKIGALWSAGLQYHAGFKTSP